MHHLVYSRQFKQLSKKPSKLGYVNGSGETEQGQKRKDVSHGNHGI